MGATVRRAAIGAALVAVLLLTACLGPEQTTASKLVNTSRAAAGLRALGTQAEAQAKAQAWAEKLAREGKLYHSTLGDGIRIRYCSIGENVGYSQTLAKVQAAFMASAGHKANILGTKWNGVGVGVAHRGRDVYVVQVFIKTC
jgi:uncharacterized protein YkwD